MPTRTDVPQATVDRVSLYHCFLGELLRVGAPGRITSRQLAGQLSIKEETVRRDISFVGDIGRPGAGYEPQGLFDAFTDFLGLEEEYPVAKVGTAQMLEALELVFPPNRWGVRPEAYFSESPDDVGKVVGDVEVGHLTDIPRMNEGRERPIEVALLACSPGWIQISIDLLAQAGVRGVLLLTPSIKLEAPEGMEVTHIRMPCDIKSLACRCRTPAVR